VKSKLQKPGTSTSSTLHRFQFLPCSKLLTIPLLILLTLAFGWTAVHGQSVVPVGLNFEISADALGDIGGKPAIAYDGTNFFVVWHDFRDSATNGPDIYGARVTPDGTVLDPAGIPISTFANADPSPGAQYVPSVAFDGTNYLVVWTAHRDPDPDYEVYAARVTPDGTVLDPGGIQITSGASPLRMPSIVFDGTNYLVVWRTAGSQIRAVRVSTSGANLDSPTGFFIGNGFYPYVAFDGTNYMVAWHNWGNGLDIFGAQVSQDGTVLDPGVFTISDANEDQDHVSIAFGGTNYLVVWGDFRRGNQYNGTTYGARVSTGGTVLDSPSFKIADYSLSGAASGTGSAAVVFDGTNYFVIWNEYNVPADFRLWDVYGRRVSTDGIRLDEQAIPISTSYGHQFSPVVGFSADRYLIAWSEGLSDRRCGVLFSGTAGGCIFGQLLEKQPFEAATPTKSDPGTATGTWVAQGSPTGAALHAVWGFDETHVYAVSEEDNQRLFRFDGSQWISVAGLTNARKFGVWGLGPNDVWTVGWCMDVVNYDGQNVNSSDCLDFIGLGIWGTSDTNIITVGIGGVVFRYDGGPGNFRERWTMMSSNVTVDLRDIWGTSNNNVYAVGDFGTIIKFDGTNWVKETNVPSIQSLNGIWGSSASDIFVVGDFGTILHYDGTAWSVQNTSTREHLQGIWGFSGSSVYTVGFNGTILRYDGFTWNAEVSGTSASLEDVWGVGNSMWAVGDSGTILRKQVEPVISVTPSSEDFGNVNVGSSADRTFSVQNTGDGTLTGSASTSAPFSIVSGSFFSLGAGESRTLVVRFSPTTAGASGGNINFTSNGGNISRVVTGTGVPIFALTVSKVGTGGGTVTSDPAGINCGSTCSETHGSGTSVTLTATPAAGSAFVVWNGGGCSGRGTCTVTLNADTSVTATFSSSAFTLTVTKAGSGDGTITSSQAGISCGSDCTEDYASGGSVTLTANPNNGSSFKAWSGPCSGSGTCTVTMSADRSVTATYSNTFTDDPLTLQVTPIKALHITELRQAINTLRLNNGRSAFAYTDSTLIAGVTQAREVHITELRTALNAVYDALGRTRPTYTDSTIVAGQTVVKKVHIEEIRSAVRAVETVPTQ